MLNSYAMNKLITWLLALVTWDVVCFDSGGRQGAYCVTKSATEGCCLCGRPN